MAQIVLYLETMKLLGNMNLNKVARRTQEQERDIINILIDSSLYLDRSPVKRQRLLDYLVSSYFDPLLYEKNRPALN